MSMVVCTLIPPCLTFSLPKRSSNSFVTASLTKGDLLLRHAVGLPTKSFVFKASCSSSGVIQLRVRILAKTCFCLALVLL